MALTVYPDTEALVKTWLAGTPVADLVRRPDNGLNIFEAMPLSSPLPAVVLSRVGGAPDRNSDVPVDIARISFDCWAATRAQARQIAGALASAAVNLSEHGGYESGTARLYVAEIVGWVWLPDPQADMPRYIVDALFTAINEP